MTRKRWGLFAAAACALCLYGGVLLVFSLRWNTGVRGAVLPLLVILTGALFAHAALRARHRGHVDRADWYPAFSTVLLGFVWQTLQLLHVIS